MENSSFNEHTLKVCAYVTHEDRLLVFRHTNFPEAGIQVPAGTVKPDEPLEAAVLRETNEESGLEGLVILAYLGMDEFDLESIGKEGLIQRHYFHLQVDGSPLELWRHFEKDPSNGSTEPIEFEFYWVNILDEMPELAGGQGRYLEMLAA